MKPPARRASRLASQLVLGAALLATPALAGPPFISDDPDPTPNGHYEILLFGSGTRTSGNMAGDAGLDFNYGGGPNLQLTATVPISFEDPRVGPSSQGLGTVELAAKYRFIHHENGWSAAVFPRLFVPAGPGSANGHVSLLLPVWVGRSGEGWGTFGGGGCALTSGGNDQNYCQEGLAVTRDVSDRLHLGGEVFHQSADSKGGFASTLLGVGATFDINENLHLLGWLGRGMQNPAQTGRGAGYGSILFTF